MSGFNDKMLSIDNALLAEKDQRRFLDLQGEKIEHTMRMNNLKHKIRYAEFEDKHSLYRKKDDCVINQINKIDYLKKRVRDKTGGGGVTPGGVTPTPSAQATAAPVQQSGQPSAPATSSSLLNQKNLNDVMQMLIKKQKTLLKTIQKDEKELEEKKQKFVSDNALIVQIKKEIETLKQKLQPQQPQQQSPVQQSPPVQQQQAQPQTQQQQQAQPVQQSPPVQPVLQLQQAGVTKRVNAKVQPEAADPDEPVTEMVAV